MDNKQEFHQIEEVEWEDIPGRKKNALCKSPDLWNETKVRRAGCSSKSPKF